MPSATSILANNMGFLGSVYNMKLAAVLMILLVATDVILKGWGMWRAARLEKKWWFISLLIINSIGILPVIFILMTRDDYAKLDK